MDLFGRDESHNFDECLCTLFEYCVMCLCVVSLPSIYCDYLLFVYVETVDLTVTWDGTSVTVVWTDRFEAPPGVPLYYEVSLGTQVGSAAVTRWKQPLETVTTSFKFTDVRLNRLTDYFLSLTAIAYTGYSTTLNFMITNTDAVLIPVV